jgi:hypothetical protein
VASPYLIFLVDLNVVIFILDSFAADNNSGENSGQQGRENTDPLPNPWAPGGGSPSTTSSSTGTTNSTTNAGGPHGRYYCEWNGNVHKLELNLEINLQQYIVE